MRYELRLYKELSFKEIEKIGEFLFGVNREYDLLKKYNIKPLYIDTPLEYKEYPTITALFLLKDLAKDKVYLDEVGARDFIYGKDVHQKNFLKIEGYKYANLLVLNGQGLPLGIGKIKGKILKNLFNISFYRRY
ncbi:NEQ499 [Nanoarchaeum equitans Kin4-M]|uniref:NEQ499 n=1 Tax=Nanoarchaeum equitans (strain Kin4-M) TaxID=228908 RepID=Q74MW3_NANEQ|nr:NEQ499 [Nanoarchaeum equitans Kin4-M]